MISAISEVLCVYLQHPFLPCPRVESHKHPHPYWWKMGALAAFLFQKCHKLHLVHLTAPKKTQNQTNQKISACTLFTFIKADEEGSFLGCHTFKIKWSTQPGKLMESVWTFMFYIAATPFHFPVGRIDMPLATTWNLYTSDPKMGEPLLVSLPSACFHSELPR